MKIYSDGKNRVFNGAFPKHFRLLNGEKEVPFIRTGRESVRLSGELPIGDLLVEEIIKKKVAQPAKLDAQSIAIINKQDFDRIDILNKKLVINQEKMGDQMNALAEHEATLANLETKNAGDIELLSGQTASAVQMLKGAIEDTEKKNVAVQKALSQAIKETGEDLSDSLVAHETAKNPHRITKATIGLEKLENIKPEDMPVSKAVKKELDKKADKKDIAEVEKKLTEKSDKIVKGIERMNMLGGVGGNELPVGGKKGQVLAKASNKTGDYEWSSAAGGVSIHNYLDGRDADKCHPISAIDGLQTALTTETTNRENSDNGLQSQIDAITASSDVKDIVGTYADLQAYDTSTLGNNDIIKVLQDETHSDETTYYRWSTATETFTLIGEEGPYYTKSEANSTFVPQTRTVNGKALSENISLTATDVGALPSSTVIPTVNNATLTVTLNGVSVGTFTANSSEDVTIPVTDTTYSAFVGTDGEEDGAAGLVPAPTTYDYSYVLKGNGSWGQVAYSEISGTPTIPTSADYWTVGTQGVSNYQTTYSKKTIFYTASGAQDNGLKVLSSSDTSPSATIGSWSGRCLFGNEKRTFLLGTARNSASTSTSICGIGAHTWGSASAQTSAAWDNVYIQPDGNTGVYLGGYQWRGNSGWFRVQNNGNGSASYRTEINTGTNSSPAWKKVLPNNATGTSSILFTPTVSTTFTYTYATSVNGTVTANYGTSYGYSSSAGTRAVGLGYNAKATGSDSIQLGQGTNSTANTLSVGLSSSLNVQLLDSTGEIPDARIKTTIARVSQIPTTAAQVNALPDSTKYGADLDYTNSTLQLLDQDGNALGNPVTISGGGNTNNLLDFKWTDHELTDQSWLRADTFSWQDGTVYSDAYDHLVDDIDGKTAQTETVGSYTISYYLADDGHKITTDETTVSNIYNESGVAWYYILDTANQRFKLPRTKYGFTGLRDGVGNYVPETVPNIWYSNGGLTSDPAIDGALEQNARWNIQQNETVSSTRFIASYSFNATRCSDAYQDNAPVQQRATQMYLYFYVGQFTQSATEQTAGLNSELFNGKVDLNAANLSTQGKSLISGFGMPSDTYDDLTLGASGSTYTAPANGYFVSKMITTAVNGYLEMSCSATNMDSIAQYPAATAGVEVCIPVKKDDVITFSYSGVTIGPLGTYFRFVYAQGEENV